MAAGEKNVYQGESRLGFYLPRASTDIASGDAVMLVQSTGRIEPCTATEQGRDQFAGFSDDEWSTDIASRMFGIGSTEYATPVDARIKVNHKGRARVAILETSASAGAAIYMSTAATGAQVFSTARQAAATEVMVGTLEKDFTGATANDPQNVIVADRRSNREAAIWQYLNNHIVEGMAVAFDSSSLVSNTAGKAYVNGQIFTIAANTAALGIVCAAVATAQRCVLYVVNSAGVLAIVDTGLPTFLSSVAGTTTALANSNLWPTGSYLIAGVGFVGSNSVLHNAGSVRTMRRSVADLAFRRSLNNA